MEFKTSLKHLFLATALSVSAAAWSAQQPAPAPVSAHKPVNINTADASAIADALKGVGPAKAQAIVAYRKEHGPFKSPEQLADVKGIGDKLVVANRDRIAVK